MRFLKSCHAIAEGKETLCRKHAIFTKNIHTNMGPRAGTPLSSTKDIRTTFMMAICTTPTQIMSMSIRSRLAPRIPRQARTISVGAISEATSMVPDVGMRQFRMAIIRTTWSRGIFTILKVEDVTTMAPSRSGLRKKLLAPGPYLLEARS